MKTVFTKVVLATLVGLPYLLAAGVIGLMPPSSLSAEMLIGCYVAGGVLAFAFNDYGRGSARIQPRSRQANRSQPAAGSARRAPVLAWSHQTISA